MHNSLFTRDLLRRTNSDPLRLDRRDPHRAVGRDPDAIPGDGDFALTGAWQVVCSAAPDVAVVLVDDVMDFLARMGVATAPDAPNVLAIVPAADLGARDCRLTLHPGAVTVAGGDVAGLWAGVAWLEWEMRTRRGPFLPMGEITRHAAWPVQISQGPWGANYSVPDFTPEYLSDDGFRLYAHYGVNSMMIYGDLLCYVDSAIFPELNFPGATDNLAILADAARRAARYGVQFSYLVVGPKLRADHPVFVNHPNARGTGMNFTPDDTPRAEGGGLVHCLCSGDPQVQAFYDELFTRLFTAAPELAGLILIVGGESFYHCKIWPFAQHPCPHCGDMTAEDALADVLAVVERAVKRAQPRAYVAAWAYTTHGWDRPDRLEFVRRLPAGVDLYHHIEKDQYLRKDGYVKRIWDYSIDFTGPSDGLRAIAEIAHQQERPLFIKTETGIGLETFQFPYVPAMQRLAEKWQHVRDLAPKGVQQSWLFFGMFGSRAEELGLWAAYAPEMTRDDLLRRMAARDFGPATVDAVLASWEQMSRAVGHLPCVCFSTYYIGPGFLGPAHPLVPTRGATIPDAFHGILFYLQELEESLSTRQVDVVKSSLVLADLPERADVLWMQWDGPSDGWDIVLREYTAAATDARAAWEVLMTAASLTATPTDCTNLRDELLLTELIYRTFYSCENVLRFLLARRDVERTDDAAARAEMRRIAVLERANALAAVPIYTAAPWLDLAKRTDGKYTPCAEMIAEKVRWIDAFLGEQ